MRQKGIAHLFLLVVVVIIGIGAIGYLAYQNVQLRNKDLAKISPTPTPIFEAEPTISTSPITASTTTPTEIVPISSTDDWIEIQNNGVSFKIPPNASCNDNQLCSQVSWSSDYQGHTIPHYIYLKVEDYLGGSRREQFIATHTEITSSCQPIYKEAMFGSVKALQIAVDGGLCQGSIGGIVAVIGEKLVVIDGGLSYNPDTKEIGRWVIRDTLISTLKFVK